MSFSKTVSVVAALASIFSVGVASWKLSEQIKTEQTSPLEQRIDELESELKTAKEQVVNTNPPTPVVLPQQQPQVQIPQATPSPPQLPTSTPAPTPPAPQPPTP